MMTRPPQTQILAELKNPTSTPAHLAALRALKNDIVGHEQKKELWLELGVLGPLIQLAGSPKGLDIRKDDVSSGNGPTSTAVGVSRNSASELEENLRLQATLILGSFAEGGSTFINALISASVIPALLSALCPFGHTEVQVLAILQVLNTISDALLLEYPETRTSSNPLSRELFSKEHITLLTQLLQQRTNSSLIDHQITLVASLIAKTCTEEQHQSDLVDAGILDALTNRLAYFIIQTGSVLPGVWDASESFSEALKTIPASPQSALAPILEAIAVIIQRSKFRISQFLLSPVIAALLPTPSEYHKMTSLASSLTSSHISRRQFDNPLDHLLPEIPVPHSSKLPLPQMSGFSVLVTPENFAKQPFSMSNSAHWPHDTDSIDAQGQREEESPLLAWLLFLARMESGYTRLMAAWVLTIIYRASTPNKKREISLALLVVPILVGLLDENNDTSQWASLETTKLVGQIPGWGIRERASMVLAMLVKDSIDLQKAAVDAGVIKHLSQLLKKSFDPIIEPASAAPRWSPDPTSDYKTTEQAQAYKFSPLLLSRMRLREGALRAIAAIAPFKEDFRKMLIDSGVVPFIVDAMKPLDSELKPRKVSNAPGERSQDNKPEDRKSGKSGNLIPVLVAACGAARALARSVSALRTELVDAGVATPLFGLLQHPDIQVKIAATAVIINLVLEFSPMREAIVKAGVLKILCEHAHSTNAELRLNAVWALKHFVYLAERDDKMTCLDELGQGWLVQIICNDAEDSIQSSDGLSDAVLSRASSVGLSTPNAAGQQVNILNNARDLDIMNSRLSASSEREAKTSGEDSMIGEYSSDMPPHELSEGSRPGSSLSRSSATTQARLAALRQAETNSALKARQEDMAVQEQGLDFIRNLICGNGNQEMIDILFDSLGQDRVFDILASKLKPRALNAYARDRRTSSFRNPETRMIQPPTEIVVAVAFIIVHIAAGHPRHKQLLISQTELMKLMVPLFNHNNKVVRSAMVWAVINLTWIEDQNDQSNAKARALELRSLGVEQSLRALEHDPELDVRERTKTALSQMNGLFR